MLHRLFTMMVVIAALTLLTGCGGGKSRKRTKAPEPPATVVDPVPTPGDEDGGSDDGTTPDGGSLPDDGNPDDGMPDDGNPDDGNPDDGIPDDSMPDDGSPGDGNPDGGNPDDGNPGGPDPFEPPSGEIDPLDPIFPVNENPGDEGDGGDLIPLDESVAMPEPATLLTTILGASLLGMRSRRRQTH